MGSLVGLVWGIKRQRQRHFPKLKSNLAIGKVAGLTQHWGIERQMERRSSTSWSGILLLLERWYGQWRGKFSRTKISFGWKMIWGAHFSDYVKYTFSLHLLLLRCFLFPLLNHCTMCLSPLKRCIKEFWKNVSFCSHFPAVLLFQTKFGGKVAFTFYLYQFWLKFPL